ncbi:hypothetical protein LPB140_12010 [Sphingorhabdus lutea]|uniref:EamA domain-containing protein n=1 Tax=Sphingorhabdus lutea TaxID=1913578 RepID=A0A1L3JE43_9SPHN|nr:EamA family transporter RarD [Sphingorhabdus lutea]APG63392.1 hypothetical protein LPB140_12010 [Sphingorhabdus lutea]
MINISHDENKARTGVIQAIGAYIIWGFMPVFFKIFKGYPEYEIVAHRVIWCVPVLLLILTLRGRIGELWAALRNPQALKYLFFTSFLIAANWLIYIWAVSHDYVVAASLGYFLSPLLNIALGYIFLKERLGRLQIAALCCAILGVALLAGGALNTLWISISLALSFGFYGLIRKIAPVESLPGLAVETLWLFIPSLLLAIWVYMTSSHAAWNDSWGVTLALMASGLVTAVPLLLFASAARKINFSTIGFIQYIGPTIQFLFGVLVYKEPLSWAQISCFILIWLGIAIFTYDGLRKYKLANKPV